MSSKTGLKAMLGSAMVVLSACAMTGAVLAQDAESSAERTIFDGVFTQEQADRGAGVFSQNCAVCHGNAARGGSDAPGLVGHTLNNKYADQPLQTYFHIMQTTMPLGRGNSLPPQTYADIMAHILSLHGAPAGEEELPFDEEGLSAIQIVRAPQ